MPDRIAGEEERDGLQRDRRRREDRGRHRRWSDHVGEETTLSIGEAWKYKWTVKAFATLGLWCYFWTFLPMQIGEKLKKSFSLAKA